MRLKHIKDAEIIIRKSPYLIDNPESYKGNWNRLFNNDNNIEIEIGTGIYNSKSNRKPKYKFYWYRKV